MSSPPLAEADPVRVAIGGAGGRMGLRLFSLAAEDPRLEPVAAFHRDEQVTAESLRSRGSGGVDRLLARRRVGGVRSTRPSKAATALIVGTTGLGLAHEALLDRAA